MERRDFQFNQYFSWSEDSCALHWTTDTSRQLLPAESSLRSLFQIQIKQDIVHSSS